MLEYRRAQAGKAFAAAVARQRSAGEDRLKRRTRNNRKKRKKRKNRKRRKRNERKT